jgi:hypothetical protein
MFIGNTPPKTIAVLGKKVQLTDSKHCGTQKYAAKFHAAARRFCVTITGHA